MSNFSLPFSLTLSGQVSTTSDPNQIANDRMEALIGTYPGERVMLPDYGTPIPSLLFEPEIASEQSIVQLKVQQAVAQWEPTIVLNSVNVDFSKNNEGIANINISFALSNNPTLTPPQTATISIGGSIVPN